MPCCFMKPSSRVAPSSDTKLKCLTCAYLSSAGREHHEIDAAFWKCHLISKGTKKKVTGVWPAPTGTFLLHTPWSPHEDKCIWMELTQSIHKTPFSQTQSAFSFFSLQPLLKGFIFKNGGYYFQGFCANTTSHAPFFFCWMTDHAGKAYF